MISFHTWEVLRVWKSSHWKGKPVVLTAEWQMRGRLVSDVGCGASITLTLDKTRFRYEKELIQAKYILLYSVRINKIFSFFPWTSLSLLTQQVELHFPSFFKLCYSNKWIELIIFLKVLIRIIGWSLTLREECRLRVFDNSILRRIFGPKRDENGDWRRLHNEELHSLYRSLNIVRVIKSRRLRWAGHVARMNKGGLSKF